MSGFLSQIARTALFKFDAETAHGLTIAGLKTGQSTGLAPNCANDKYKQIALSVAGLNFPNPVGMAAGFDKNGEVPDVLCKMGFGYAEIGTVTPRPQAGNPKPRIFRLVQDNAIINRLGFNNLGHDAVFENLKSRKPAGLLGINIGANKDSEDFIVDYELGLEKFWKFADYFTANISSPNTPGLRDLQAKDALNQLLDRLTQLRDKLMEETYNSPPVFLKVAPDLDEDAMDEIANCVNASSIDGLVISNTTVSRPQSDQSISEAGGLSGRPLFEPSTIVLAKMRQRVGDELPIIGVGGIDSVDTAWEKLEAGANLLQLYTGMVYQGPALANTICRGLADRLSTAGIENIASLSGSKTAQWAAKQFPSK